MQNEATDLMDSTNDVLEKFKHPWDQDEEQQEEEIPFGPENEKYWAQRYTYFSNFDDGIQFDKGSSFLFDYSHPF